MTKKEEAQAKRLAKLEQEKKRVAGMRAFEKDALLDRFGPDFFPELVGEDTGAEGGSGDKAERKEGAGKPGILICGIDEAGRGPLAGPVAAGACILPVDHDILYINDSKKLSEKKREELYQVITEEAVAFNVALVDASVIDDINILQATFVAMRRAVEGLSVRPDALVVDAVTIPDLHIPQCGIVHGDARCLSIAAASILAKVTRDRLMYAYDKQYPEYGFAKNKGYGTAEHIAALKKYGPCPIHRKSFIGHFVEV